MSFAIPETREELIEALKKEDRAYLCAGGTDLMIRLREKKEFHYSLIDLTHIPELSGVWEEEEEIRIGAAATMELLDKSPVIRQWIPALSQAASMVGSTQIRNRATVGGNVANASQSSDLTPALMAYGARAAVLGETGEIKDYSLDDIVIGLGKTNLKAGEAILWFIIRKSQALSAFAKVGSRKAVAISKVNFCIKAETGDGRLRQVFAYLGAVGPKARRASIIEEALEGAELGNPDLEKLKAAVYAQIEENIPDRSSKHYKKPAAYGIVCDALDSLRRGAERQSGAKTGRENGGRETT